MKINQEEVVDQQTVLHIELEEEDLATYLDRGYRRVVNRANIPGFRKGKAPRAIVERYLGRGSLLTEVMDYMLPDVTQRAIDTQDLETAGTPKVELLELEPVTLKATVALTPQVDLGAYRDIRLEESAVEITEDDIQQRLQGMQKNSGAWEPAERPVKLGDMVTMDVVGMVDDRSVLDQKGVVYVADKDSNLPFPGFSRNLEGAAVAAPQEFTLDIPNDYTDSRIAGKEANFTVIVSEVKEQNLPELDDEFAKSAGDGYESLAALREAIETDLQAEAEQAQLTQYREASLDELLKVTTVEMPPLLVEHEVEHMVSRRDQLVDRLNMRLDDYLTYTGKTEDQIRDEMNEHAVERLTRSYALAELAEREGLEVSAEEIDEKIQAIEASGDEQAEALKDRDLDSQEIRNSISETLLVGKSLDRLTAVARGEDPKLNSSQQGSEEEGDTVDDDA